MSVIFNGKLYQASQVSLVSPFLSSFQFSQGVFETLRTYHPQNPQIFHLDAHLDRLIESASTLKIKTPLPFKSTLKKNCQELLETTLENKVPLEKGGFSGIFPNENFRLKIFYTSEFYWITINPLPEFAEANYLNGISITDVIFERNFPAAKYPNPAYKIFAESQPKSCFETIFFNQEGFLREGNISNVFAVFNKKLYTPNKNILPGITRKIILEIAGNLEIPIILGEITREKLKTADEIFLTNTTKEILPVKEWKNWKSKKFAISQKLRETFHKIYKIS